MAYTWTELLDDIKVRGAIPTSQITFTEARLLNLANAAMRSKIVPMVMRAREGYYSYDFDTTVTAGTSYPIPTRAVGGKLENACLMNGTYRLNLVRYYEEELDDFTKAASVKQGFYLKRNTLFLVPDDGGGWSTLRQSILMRPNEIVPQTSAALITAINTGTKVVTCETVPAAWTTANTFDFVQAAPHFDWLGVDLAVTAVTTGASGTITFSASLPSTLVVGDWIGLAQQTPVIQCPAEFNSLLAQEVANVCLNAQGDEKGYETGKSEAKMLRDDLISTITPRVEQEGKKLTNRTGILRRRL